ncbi:hypothetical protein BHE97_08525 [Aeromicrobium sp. PE09-221]|uniref:sensor histidine kinase n=1 Tax=Aeromicrobium sp. PE09-221 TaxID=1898043 RepID=UPI000B3EA672|nr:histidine kinase [Aeromicrobium sp. PE09-221]OUZ10097.1 hypothetical protein BHE97_08525 [Aeromicrobium sp. PE09-221]
MTEPLTVSDDLDRPPRRDSFQQTWRYNYWSLWIYLVFGSFGAVANALGLAPFGTLRRVVVLALIAAIIGWAGWWARRLIVGRGRGVIPRAAFIGVIALSIPFVILSGWDPAAPIGYLLVPWAAATVLGLDFGRSRYLMWLVAWAVALAALRFGVFVVSGGDLGDYLPDDFAAWYLLGFFCLFLPAAAWVQMWVWELTIGVRDAGVTKAELARVRERLRFAADLHDIQGHHLQVLALKTELAERLIDRDPEEARRAIHEAQQIARTALEETRTLAHGYRQVSLRDEIVNAASVLEAAGAIVEVDIPDDLDDPLLATALREATTNILRHSQAGRVHITGSVGPPTLRVVNDGVGTVAAGRGSGLASLAERLAAAGGDLRTEHAEDRFEFVAIGRGS